jgi:hypothetical protein
MVVSNPLLLICSGIVTGKNAPRNKGVDVWFESHPEQKGKKMGAKFKENDRIICDNAVDSMFLEKGAHYEVEKVDYFGEDKDFVKLQGIANHWFHTYRFHKE